MTDDGLVRNIHCPLFHNRHGGDLLLNLFVV